MSKQQQNPGQSLFAGIKELVNQILFVSDIPGRLATGNSFDEMMRNFESQRDAEFSSHLYADHPRKSR
jgi:hypothetical protein